MSFHNNLNLLKNGPNKGIGIISNNLLEIDKLEILNIKIIKNSTQYLKNEILSGRKPLLAVSWPSKFLNFFRMYDPLFLKSIISFFSNKSKLINKLL